MSLKCLVVFVFLLVTVTYCQDYTDDSPDNGYSNAESYDEESYDEESYGVDSVETDNANTVEDSEETDDNTNDEDTNGEESEDTDDSDENTDGEETDDNDSNGEESENADDSDENTDGEETIGGDSNDDSNNDPNGAEVEITGSLSNSKMARQTLDLASDIRSDIASVLNIPLSAVRIISLRENGNTYTALVEFLDSATLSAEDAADELRQLEATNDPVLQNTTLENADIRIVDVSNSFSSFSPSSFSRVKRSNSDSSGAKELSATLFAVVGFVAFMM